MEKKKREHCEQWYTHKHASDIPSFLCSAAAEKKAFHDINLSNSENTEGARWMCSRLQSVLVSLVNGESFCPLFPSLNRVLFTSCL